ncbi:hypothetical protein [Chitinophaga ginsengisoli]|uniref:Uncharacterized protein n=1 Tax=Chitinophaga ginsengisoli TaxID=363837 RepID=A0A2P8GLB6_9BACT|nr:hypothetical protein [Chitinophaga ginsengisoli]PSL34740.1 hypothetical protein CLV42_102313 [Chitinophaga ginsengisoli]
MKNYSYILLALTLAGCVENKSQEQQADSTVQTVEKNNEPAAEVSKAPEATSEKIIRERAQGTVTLLDSANGRPIVQVNDNVQLEAGIPRKGWASTLVTTELNDTQTEGQLLKKGSPIIADGKTVGKVLEDVVIEMTFKNDKGVNTGVFHAAVQQNKIKTGTVIENVLARYLQEHTGKTLADMQAFIKQFQLEALDINKPYIEYYNYESAADDPSPGYRTVLVFHQDKLIGVVDSRTLQLADAKHYQLDRDYHGYFFTDTDEKLRKEYIKKFNQFVNAAD